MPVFSWNDAQSRIQEQKDREAERKRQLNARASAQTPDFTPPTPADPPPTPPASVKTWDEAQAELQKMPKATYQAPQETRKAVASFGDAAWKVAGMPGRAVGEVGEWTGRTGVRFLGDTARGGMSLAQGAKRQGWDAFLRFVDYHEPELGVMDKVRENPELHEGMVQQLADIAKDEVGSAGWLAAKTILPDTDEEAAERRRLVDKVTEWKEDKGYSAEAKEQLAKGEWWKPSAAATVAGDVGTQLAVALGANLLFPGAGNVLMAGMEAGRTRADTMDRMNKMLDEEGVDLSRHDAELASNAEAAIVGGTTYVANKLPFHIMGQPLSRALAAKTSGKVAAQLMSKLSVPGTALAEGVSEALEGASADVAQFLVEDDWEVFKGFWGRRAAELGIASIAGGAVKVGEIGVNRKPRAMMQLRKEVYERAQTPEGRAALAELNEIESPTRGDLRRAGLDVKIKLNKDDRQDLSRMVDLDMFDSMVRMVADIASPKETKPVTAEDTVETSMNEDPVQDIPRSPEDLKAAIENPQADAKAHTIASQHAIGTGDTDAAKAHQQAAQTKAKETANLAQQATATQEAAQTENAAPSVKDKPTEKIVEGPRAAPAEKPILPGAIREETGAFTPAALFNTANIAKASQQAWDFMVHTGRKAKSFATMKSRLLPEMQVAKDDSTHRLSRYSAEMEQALTDYQEGAKEAAGVDPKQGVPEAYANKADQYLKGNMKLKDLPREMQVPTKKLREMVDRLSKLALDTGAITGDFQGSVQARSAFFDQLRAESDAGRSRELIIEDLEAEGMDPKLAGTVASVIRNDGLYLTRTYDAFTDPTWRDQMPKSVRDNMANLLVRERQEKIAKYERINKHRARKGRPELAVPKPHDARTVEIEMNRILDDALDKGEQQGLVNYLGRQSRTSLKNRKNIEKVWRDFLGEVKDPQVNVIRSGLKLLNMIENYRLAQDIRREGEGKFMWTEDDPNRPEDASVLIAEEGDMAMEPLAGMWATREVRDMFKQNERWDPNTAPWWYRSIMAVDRGSQLAKTAFSWTSHMRQYAGNPLMMMSNGHWNLLKNNVFFGQPSEKIWDVVMKGKGTEEQRRLYNRGAELGLGLGQGLEYGMFQRWGEKTTLERLADELQGDHSVPNSAMKSPEKLMDYAKKRYGYEDVVFKFMAWEAEMAKYKKTGMFEDTEDGRRQLEEYCADIVRRTMPSYNDLPHWLQTIRDAPAIGQFMAFPLSQVVNAGNRLNQGVREVRSSNPAVKAMGIKRLASQATVYSMPYIVEHLSAMMSGLSPQDRKDMRELQPDFMKWAPIWFFGRNAEGKPRFVNYGYVDPSAYFTKPVRIAMNGGSDGEIHKGFLEATLHMLEPFLGPTMAGQAVMKLATGRTQYGSEIYNKHDNPGFKLSNLIHAVYNDTLKTGTQRDVEGYLKGALGITSPGGKVYSAAGSSATMLTGYKVETFDPIQAFEFSMGDFASALEASRKAMRKGPGREGTVLPGETQRVTERVDAMRANAVREANRKYEAARGLEPDTVTEGYLRELLGKRFRVSDEEIDQVFTGIATPYIPRDLKVMERLAEQAQTPERKQQLLAAREVKLNEYAYKFGDVEKDTNQQERARIQEQLSARNITPEETVKRTLDHMKQLSLDGYIRSIKRKVGGRYSDEVIRQAAVMKARKTGIVLSKARKERLKRISEQLGMSISDLAELIKGA